MFTDSVQDAAHRAGFVQARSHTLSLRAALRAALGDSELDLTELTQAVINRAGDNPILRYQLLPPDIVDRDEFVAFWKANAHPNSRRAAENKAKRRLQFDVDLELGLQSRTGRTLELTGSVAAEVYLGAPQRSAIIGRRAVEKAVEAGSGTQVPLSDIDDAALTRWVRGTVERIRTRGAIHHDWLRRYLERTPTATTSGVAGHAGKACPHSRKAAQHPRSRRSSPEPALCRKDSTRSPQPRPGTPDGRPAASASPRTTGHSSPRRCSPNSLNRCCCPP